MNASWQKSLARNNVVGWLAVVALLAVGLQGATLISNWSSHRLGRVKAPSSVVRKHIPVFMQHLSRRLR